jgi:tetratricopeptide (TPR) repeat protein
MHYFDRLRICEFVDEDFPLAIEYLNKAYVMDSTNYDLHGYFGEYYMLNRDYVNSFKHFELWLKKANLTGQMAVYGMHRVGWAYWMNGYEEEGRKFFLKQIDYCNRMLEMGRVIGTAYRNYYDLAASYAFMGQKEMALVNLRLFMKYLTGDKWYAMYFNNDPLFDNIRGEPEFQQIVRDVEAKYQAQHERVRQWLEENDMQ